MLFICHTSEEEHFYISLYDHLYKLASSVKAFDVLFKLFLVLDLKYPPEAAHIWTYIQNYIYNIYTAYDKVSSSAETLMSEMTKLAQKGVNVLDVLL